MSNTQLPGTKFCCGCVKNEDHLRCHWCGRAELPCFDNTETAIQNHIGALRIWTDVIRQKATRYFK